LAKRTVIVTGAAGGIGQATVALFQRHGWFVIGIDRTEEAAPDRSIVCDLSKTDQIERAFASIEDRAPVDALVNNAAVHFYADLSGTGVEEWDEVMAVNVRSAFLATRLAQPMMRNGGGSVVNVSSVHAVATTRGVAAYATSKGALVALTRNLALELAPAGIRVNAVLPGAIDTPMLAAGRTSSEREATIDTIASRMPLGRIGRPDEVADAILFLADGERSSFITGQTLVVDGGALARLGTE
jgi:NAD(P)-dependent dehydrogenase (short-subunit alcohol dehydrogenase family)